MDIPALKAERGQTEYGICSTTFLQVHGQAEPFLHRDRNHLVKVGEPGLNPWAKLKASGS